MLTSQLLGSSADLQSVSTGVRRIAPPETSDAVGLVQAALVATGYSMPTTDIDGILTVGGETAAAIVSYKTDHGLAPTDPVVGVGTSRALDAEIAFLEDATLSVAPTKAGVLALDPYKAGLVEIGFADTSIGDKVLDLFELGDRICFRLSMELGAVIAQWFGETIVEPLVFKDFKDVMAPSGPHDFFDDSKGPSHYTRFLSAQHPGLSSAQVAQLGRSRRPDMMRHDGANSEWYEIKPASVSGARDATLKLLSILRDYSAVGLPYNPGRKYTPTREFPLLPMVGPGGERIQPVLELRRPVRGLIFWTLCIKGDYVEFFNRARLVAGLLAIMIALAEATVAAAGVAGAAEAATAVIAAMRALAAAAGVAVPVLSH
ncbi:peptidoglycan-binding protein [Phytoactinopolyspora limicola]|uniref:peptidoglycan-binding protein n=1 Tax=Phytoactinopolyspora limicola TaxID=2715536 RepID=UPI00140A45B2|nr:peptidoglycan-binding protein [Phytoactinopolyspora limicola]